MDKSLLGPQTIIVNKPYKNIFKHSTLGESFLQLKTLIYPKLKGKGLLKVLRFNHDNFC